MRTHLLVLAAALAAAAPLHAQTDSAEAAGPIQDNSFLVEEAYNQERGVVQHISNFVRDRGGAWMYTFTQEWPLGGIRHQLSYTLPLAHTPGETGIGDIAVNYRYQLVGDGDAALAISPRLTAILPTGDADRGFGSGGAGIQGAVPLSWVVVKDRLVAHSNAGVTWTPRARDAAGNRAATTSVSLAQSAVWLVRPMFNLFVEGVWTRDESVAGPGSTDSGNSATISPGVRFGWNLPHGLQVVPGVAVPIGIGPSAGERSLFLYLSFEHPFTNRR
ncbi:transporter [Longimicrobium sp.]|uniref:transporter n=1 Tax=Longimicrobium sp. TaxID=2029185 RepID=UPI002CF66989|nr:transporter [Longimicrobium sp.]HSU13103.1 transporter [Longimicrobium sp.]